MRNRVDKLGVAEPHIQKQGSDQIVIQLAGVHDAAAAAKLIGKTAQLELYDLEPALVPPSVTRDAANPWRPRASTTCSRASRPPRSRARRASTCCSSRQGQAHDRRRQERKRRPRRRGIASPARRRRSTATRRRATPACSTRTRARCRRAAKVLTVPHGTVVITCSSETSAVCPGDPNGVPPPGKTDYYLFKHGAYPSDRYATNGKYPNMGGKELKLSGTRQDFDPTTGDPVVLMQFTGKGNKIFHEVTKNEAMRGSIQQTAAALRDRARQRDPLVAADRLQPVPRQGIDPTGSGAQITGLQSLKEAKDLALVLQTGALPVNFVTLERTDVSATLGKDSLKQARDAAIGGLIAVAIFLLIAYRFLGLVAVIGLGIYAALMYGAILLLGVTLTLPGFAGLILTIGVAADANIVVFERIKEEVRAGKIDAQGDRRRLREGLPHDHRRERRDGDHGADPVRRRDRRREGLRADAADRHRGLAAHRRRGDARDARPALRLPLVRQPALHGRRRRAGHEVPADRLHAPPQPLVRDLGRRGPDQRRLARRPRPQPRHRLQGRRPGHVQDAAAYTSLSKVRDQTASIGMRRTRSSRAAARRRAAARTTRASRSS